MQTIVYQEQAMAEEDGAELPPPSGYRELPLGQFIFKHLIFFGVLPPLDILNDALRAGSAINHDHVQAEWPGFELDELDYQRLRVQIELHPEWGGVIDDSGASHSAGEWFHWAFVRSIGRHA